LVQFRLIAPMVLFDHLAWMSIKACANGLKILIHFFERTFIRPYDRLFLRLQSRRIRKKTDLPEGIAARNSKSCKDIGKRQDDHLMLGNVDGFHKMLKVAPWPDLLPHRDNIFR